MTPFCVAGAIVCVLIGHAGAAACLIGMALVNSLITWGDE